MMDDQTKTVGHANAVKACFDFLPQNATDIRPCLYSNITIFSVAALTDFCFDRISSDSIALKYSL